MLSLGSAVVLAVLAIAAFPCWRHSARWGYGPAMSAGALLVLVAVVTVGSKPKPGQALVEAPTATVRISADEVRLATLLGAEEAADIVRQ